MTLMTDKPFTQVQPEEFPKPHVGRGGKVLYLRK